MRFPNCYSDLHQAGSGYRPLSVELASTGIEHGTSASLELIPKATIVDIRWALADHVEALKSNDSSALRKGCQIQTKEQAPGYAFPSKGLASALTRAGLSDSHIRAGDPGNDLWC